MLFPDGEKRLQEESSRRSLSLFRLIQPAAPVSSGRECYCVMYRQDQRWHRGTRRYLTTVPPSCRQKLKNPTDMFFPALASLELNYPVHHTSGGWNTNQRDCRSRRGCGSLESHRVYRAGGCHRGAAGANDAGQTVPTNHGENFGGGVWFCGRHVRDAVVQVFDGGYSCIGDHASRIDSVRDLRRLGVGWGRGQREALLCNLSRSWQFCEVRVSARCAREKATRGTPLLSVDRCLTSRGCSFFSHV